LKKKIYDVQEPMCAVDYAFRRIGGKYKGRIIYYLKRFSVMRYGELRRAILDITPKMLTQTLRELEEDGLINREVYHEVPPRVEYSLTAVGEELIPFIEHLRAWGEKRMEIENIPILMPGYCETK
jgi:DNA-binding HxlR family transcriptional regulator